MSDLTTGGINFEYPCAFRIDKEAVEKQDKALRKSIEKAFTIEELEKIKAEMMSLGNWRERYEVPYDIERCLWVIDNHIKELKGENNA